MELLTEIEGKIAIFLQVLDENLNFDTYYSAIQEDELNLVNSPSNRFYSYNLQYGKGFVKTYPTIMTYDVSHDFQEKFQVRFQRLYALSKDMYHFKVIHTVDSIPNILEYAKKQKITRILLFQSIDLVSDYFKLVKIFKLNSFLANREMNTHQSSNLFADNGFIRNKRIDKLFQGKGKAVNRFTFQALDLILDRELDSNVAYINKIWG
ncbi:MAG: hypothetical protein AAF518_01980 [Spirochaetota bacterium]